jgi:hypothetical protein
LNDEATLLQAPIRLQQSYVNGMVSDFSKSPKRQCTKRFFATESCDELVCNHVASPFTFAIYAVLAGVAAIIAFIPMARNGHDQIARSSAGRFW